MTVDSASSFNIIFFRFASDYFKSDSSRKQTLKRKKWGNKGNSEKMYVNVIDTSISWGAAPWGAAARASAVTGPCWSTFIFFVNKAHRDQSEGITGQPWQIYRKLDKVAFQALFFITIQCIFHFSPDAHVISLERANGRVSPAFVSFQFFIFFIHQISKM